MDGPIKSREPTTPTTALASGKIWQSQAENFAQTGLFGGAGSAETSPIFFYRSRLCWSSAPPLIVTVCEPCDERSDGVGESPAALSRDRLLRQQPRHSGVLMNRSPSWTSSPLALSAVLSNNSHRPCSKKAPLMTRALWLPAVPELKKRFTPLLRFSHLARRDTRAAVLSALGMSA